jgi:hypothetical protein
METARRPYRRRINRGGRIERGPGGAAVQPCINPKRQEMSHGESKRPMRRREGVGGKETMKGEDRPVRAACLYATESMHGPYKSGEMLSERPIPASGASVSRCSDTEKQITRLIIF